MKEQIQKRIAEIERYISEVGWYDRSTANYTAGRMEAMESELHFLKSLVGK